MNKSICKLFSPGSVWKCNNGKCDNGKYINITQTDCKKKKKKIFIIQWQKELMNNRPYDEKTLNLFLNISRK